MYDKLSACRGKLRAFPTPPPIFFADWGATSRRSFIALTACRHLLAHADRCIQQSDVRERLRHVAEERTAARIDLLRQQPDIIPPREQLLEQLARFVAALRQRARLGEPEAAREERAFARWQTVLRRPRVVSINQIVSAELAPDRIDRRLHARIARLEKADARDVQQTRIELVAVECRDERVALAIEAAREHDLPNLVLLRAPSIRFRQAFRRIERRPGHDFSVHVLLA